MHPFTVMVAALAALIASGVVGSRTDKPRLKAAMQGATLLALLVFLGCVALGLWQAWSPWELEVVER